MLTLLGEHACFGGVQRFYQHDSSAIGLPMRFSIYLPPGFEAKGLPVLFYLAGLTCTEETFAIKGGAQRVAAEEGLALVMPDTSPRGANVAGETDSWDFGVGAGFYVDATQAPWSRHYRMYSYILELRELVLREFGLDAERCGIFGHSMGGHGALVLALRNPTLFRSVSAFAPIAAPTRCPWGDKAFSGYLGPDKASWNAYDATELVASGPVRFPQGILVDQGLADKFLAEQLNPDAFEAACAEAGQPVTLRRHAGYDHGYYFISTFVEEHLRLHRRQLG
ncbi:MULTISPECIES: S-formylglutathione hydrolase [unclassified Massilia]|uniref:S-formylglutathione hydrolase n=1 Tax=unclassified Massilia TaxID=2609279 RepID=UPI0017844D28|nr:MULTISPECIES: S-formylglutathione hydrolase [unclassified Massilia]MBD8530089.1 S-formylglutathione hydrolase [Massilia sp. CFBP 13647]MBD8674082.1 S-formylglutathione hydrolase [Massilia sp. CFBP 13721]